MRGCVLGLGLQPRPTTPGLGVGARVCLCARPACTPLLLAGVCGVGVCAWAPVSAVARHSWFGRWGVCVFVRVPRLYPAIPGGVVCVCVGLGLVCSPAFSLLGCRGPWPLVCAAFVSGLLLGGAPVAWGCAGVAVAGVCPPPSPLVFLFLFFFAFFGGCVFGPCRVVALYCPSLAIPVWGLVVSFLPSSLVRAAPSCFFFAFFFARLRPSEVCVGVTEVSSLPPGRCSRLGVARFDLVVLRCSLGGSRLRRRRAGGFARLLWCGLAVSWLWAYLRPPPFFLGGDLPVPPSAFPGLVHALVSILCG